MNSTSTTTDEAAPCTVLLYGRAGCGKGTQMALLKEFLEKNTARKVLDVETGAAFRAFTGDTSSYTGSLTKEVVERGGLPAVFISVWLWTSVLVQKYTGEEHLLFDGFPRRTAEAEVLNGALQLYNKNPVTLFILDVSSEHAAERLKLRKRADDLSDERVQRRLAWYESEVVPTIEYFKAKGEPYRVIEIDGEQSIEQVHKDIIGHLGFAS